MIQYLFSVKKKRNRSQTSQCKRSVGSTLHIEFLEARYVFSGTGALSLEDWQSAIFDNGVSGTLPFVLNRNDATVDPQGNIVGPNQPRFGDDRLLTEVGSWTPVIADIGNGEIFGSGWDHDGQTPMAIIWEIDARRLTFIKGNDFHVENVINLQGNLDLFAGTISGYRYVPQNAVVHEGLVAVMLQRERRVGSTWIVEGVSFAVTQDYGQTFQRVEQVGGGYDVPVIEGNVSDGISRSRSWSFANAFPEKSTDDKLGAWFPWADYLQRSGGPKGGQIGVFRARRDAVGEPWIVEANRLVYETWKFDDAGGLHSHTAGMFVDGMASAWGDVDYRNHMVRHVAEDLENYTMTTWTHQEDFHGAWSPDNAKVYDIGFQGLAMAPGTKFGEILMVGDETPEVIMKVERPAEIGEKAILTNMRGSFPGVFQGSSFAGRFPPNLQYQRGVGYVAREINSQVQGSYGIYFSRDGETWGTLLNLGGGQPYLYGDKVLVPYQNALHAMNLPKTSEPLAPLLLNPGGKSLAAEEWIQTIAPAEGNQVRRVLYVDGVYVYQDNGQPLDLQPKGPPPVVLGMPMYEITTSGSSNNVGVWGIAGSESELNKLHWLSAWHYSLDGDGIAPRISVGTQPNASRQSVWNANNHWVPSLNFNVPDSASSGTAAQQIRIFDGVNLAPRRWLMAVEGLSQSSAPTYPMAPNAQGAAERAYVTLGETTSSWSTALTFGLSQVSAFSTHFDPVGTGTVHTLASIYKSPSEHIDVSFTRTSTAGGVLSIDVYSSNVLLDRMSFKSIYWDREDQIRLVISNSPEELGVTMLVTRNGYGIDSKSIVGSGTSIVPIQLRLSNSTQTDVAPLEWFAIQFSPSQALTTAERELMVVSSSMFTRLDAPPVIGPPGFDGDADIDGRDFLIWQRGFGITEGATREDGDANRDGRVDELDLELWQVGYGLGVNVGPPTGDFNQDSYVDEIDLLAWQGGYGIYRTANALGQGDANGDGNVDGRDFLIWQRQYTGPAAEEPVGDLSEELTSNSEPAAIVVTELATDGDSAVVEDVAHTVAEPPAIPDLAIELSAEDMANTVHRGNFWLESSPVFNGDSRREYLMKLVVEDNLVLQELSVHPDEEIQETVVESSKSKSDGSPPRTRLSSEFLEESWRVDADLVIANWPTL